MSSPAGCCMYDERMELRSGMLPKSYVAVARSLWAFSVSTGAHRGFSDWNICYERVFEYGLVESFVARYRPKRILDVAGDLSIFAAYLVQKYGVCVDVVDLGDLDYVNMLRNRLDPVDRSRLGLVPGVRAEEAFGLGLQDYNLVYSISAIEHFDLGADEALMRSLPKLLAPNGHVIITAPFTHERDNVIAYRDKTYYETNGFDQEESSLYMRHYSVDGIGRLASLSGLIVKDLVFARENINFYDRFFLHESESHTLVAKLNDRFNRLVRRGAPIYPLLFMSITGAPYPSKMPRKRKKIYNPDTFALTMAME